MWPARRNAASPVWGAAYGYGGRKELEEAGAELVADTVKDLELLASDIRKGTEEDRRRNR